MKSASRDRPDELTAYAGPAGTSGEELRPLVVRGLAWKGTAQVSIQLTRLAVAIVLARILAPHEYGLAGMVLVFTSFVFIFSDLALGQALVQRRSLTQLDCSTAFWTSVAAGLVFFAAGAVLSGPIASFFNEPEIRPMIAVLSVSFLVAAIGTTQSALLVREMAFKSLELREIAATLLGAGVALAIALEGFGAWAIVGQQLAVVSASTVLVWRFSKWRPSLAYSRQSLRSFAGFSANVLGMNILSQLRATTDRALIGRFLGASALGAYGLAYNVILVPFNRIGIPLAQVMFPALSRIQEEPERVADYWRRSVRLLAAIAFPSLLGLLIVAPDFVALALGNEWERAVPVIQLLAIVGLLQALQFLNPIVLQALDQTTTLFRWSLVSFVAALCAFAIGLKWGIIGVAAAFAVSATLTEPAYAWLTSRALGSPFRLYLRAVAGVALAAVGMAIAVLITRLLLLETEVGAATRLGACIAVGAVVYPALCSLVANEVLAELRSALRKRSPPVGAGD